MSLHVRRTRLAIALFALCLAPAPGLAECDLLPPSLTDFDFAPQAVNVNGAPADVTCTVSGTDAPAGIGQVTCTFSSPTFLQSQSCTADAPSSGNRQAGTFSCQLTIPRYAEAGTWTVQTVTLADQAGSQRAYAGFELQMMGYPTELSVTSTPDLAGPSLASFDLQPQGIDVTTGAADVECTMQLTDTPAGVEFVTCGLTSPSEEQSQGCAAFTPSSGTPNNGTYVCTMTVPRYSESGLWQASVFANDTVGNVGSWDAAALAGLGFPSEVDVTSDPDLLAPELTDFDVAPATVDVSSSDGAVTCTMTVTDSPAGVATADCALFSPSFQRSASCSSDAPSSGTRADGVFTCSAPIPRYSEGGVWQVTNVSLQDAVGNLAEYATADLGALGFPTDVTVICEGGGATEPELRWQDDETLTWDAVTDALEYGVYRGLVTDLTDIDGDGLADNGYGDCQNARDADTTDTTFVEPEIPAGQSSFYFLVSALFADGEGTLGTSSSGLERFPTTSCF
jgi:hypothetical protein